MQALSPARSRLSYSGLLRSLSSVPRTWHAPFICNLKPQSVSLTKSHWSRASQRPRQHLGFYSPPCPSLRGATLAPHPVVERARHMSSSDSSQIHQAKKQKMSDAQVQGVEGAGIGIVTHNGTHHADEALAVALLRSLPQFSALPLTRTRDVSLIDQGTIVVDVGATYEPEKSRFDHHQRGFEHTFENGFSTKLSSAGLVWKHFGKVIVAAKLSSGVDSELVDLLWKKLYEDFIEAIDGIDNGISQYPGEALYKSSTDLSSRVGRLNPRWNEVLPSDPLEKQKEEDERFETASELAGKEFWETLDGLVKAWLPAREIVVQAVQQRKLVEGGDAQGRILVFDEYASWKDHLHKLEVHLSIPQAERPLYVIYPDSSNSWRIQAVPINPSSFESRKALPERWRGVRDAQLDELLGLDEHLKGAIFVHASGFIGGHKTRTGALAMAKAALDL